LRPPLSLRSSIIFETALAIFNPLHSENFDFHHGIWE
jgi:hypothetical protein